MFRITLFALMIIVGIAFPPLLVVIIPAAIIVISKTCDKTKELKRQREVYYDAVSEAERRRIFQ